MKVYRRVRCRDSYYNSEFKVALGNSCLISTFLLQIAGQFLVFVQRAQSLRPRTRQYPPCANNTTAIHYGRDPDSARFSTAEYHRRDDTMP